MSNEPGLTLADLAAMSEKVPVGTSFIEVKGISAHNALAIFRRFPKLLKMINGFDLGAFLEVAPEAAAAIIAAGTGHFDDAEAEEAAAGIAIETQYDILEAIGRLTFKSGFGPFVERIIKLGGNVPSFAHSGKVPALNSPPASKPSSPPATTPPTSGDTPSDKSPPSTS